MSNEYTSRSDRTYPRFLITLPYKSQTWNHTDLSLRSKSPFLTFYTFFFKCWVMSNWPVWWMNNWINMRRDKRPTKRKWSYLTTRPTRSSHQNGVRFFPETAESDGYFLQVSSTLTLYSQTFTHFLVLWISVSICTFFHCYVNSLFIITFNSPSHLSCMAKMKQRSWELRRISMAVYKKIHPSVTCNK